MRDMKDSGIEWLEDIPSHWQVMPNKRIMKKEKDLCPKYQGEDILSLTMNGVIVRDLDAGGKMPTTFDGYQRLHPGNLLMCLFDIDVTPRCIGLIKNEGLSSPAYSQFVLNEKAYAPYYYYYYLNLDHTKELLHMAKNLRHSLTESQLGEIGVAVPPYAEQVHIADYLDTQLIKVDTLISNVEAQIEKLKTYKQSLITEVVTMGLAPTVPMKCSGYDCIRSFPAHWDICRLRNIGVPQNGISKCGEYFGEGYPFVSYGDVYRNFSLPESVSGLIQSTENEQENYSVQAGDIFFTRTSETIEEVGFSCVCEKTIPNATFAGFLIRVRPFNDKLCTAYAKYYFRSNHLREFLVKEMNIVTRASLGQNLLKNIPVLLPPTEEQLAIAKELDLRCQQIDRLIAIKQEKIEKLNQYKKSLIYEYVTGKKEVS